MSTDDAFASKVPQPKSGYVSEEITSKLVWLSIDSTLPKGSPERAEAITKAKLELADVLQGQASGVTVDLNLETATSKNPMPFITLSGLQAAIEASEGKLKGNALVEAVTENGVLTPQKGGANQLSR